MRLRIKVDVRKPLKRKKKICRKDGTEIIVQCKYERLGDFCFICGLVTHTERFCRAKQDESGTEITRDWGGWLRAPPRRAAGQEKSKWLRDERDADWGRKLGKDNYPADFSGYQGDGKGKEIYQGHNPCNDALVITQTAEKIGMTGILNFQAAKHIMGSANGPLNEELTGLNIEERKRRRSGPEDNNYMDTDGGIVTLFPGAVLSQVDCATPLPTDLAELAKQASH